MAFHSSRRPDDGRLIFFSFSLSCSLNYMEDRFAYGVFILIPGLFIILYGLDFCDKSFDLFRFYPSIEIDYIFWFHFSLYYFIFEIDFKSLNIFSIEVSKG